MSDTVIAVVQVDGLGVELGSEWPADHPRVLTNPEWFTGGSSTPEPEAAAEPEPVPEVVEEPAAEEVTPEDAA